MAWSASYDESVDCCFVHWTGALDRNGLWSFVRDVAGESWFHPGVNVLHDFREAAAAPTKAEVREIAQIAQLVSNVFGDSGRVALLVPKQEEVRVAQTYVKIASGTGREFKVFTDLGETKEWMGLPDDYELPANRPSE